MKYVMMRFPTVLKVRKPSITDRLIVALLICSAVVFMTNYIFKRRKLYAYSRQFVGDLALPIVGNAYVFIGHKDDILGPVGKMLKKYEGGHPVKFWFGPLLFIIFTDPNHIEKILVSQKMSQKKEIYDLLKKYVGEGLITASGPEYRKHKKIIVPLLDLNFINSVYEVFQQYSEKCSDDIKSYCNEGTFDIEPFIHDCFINTITHSILGKKLDMDSEKDRQFKLDSVALYETIMIRVIRPWLYPDIIFQMTSIGKKEDALIKRFHSFVGEAIMESWQRFKTGTVSNEEMVPLIDNLTARTAEYPDLMNEKFFFDHIFTLFLASEDTLTMVCSFLCVCLGMYPQYQKKLAEELRNHFGETVRKASIEDISNLPYLDMCIKETMRVLPIAPIIVRKVGEDCEIDGWKLPEGASALLPVYFIHRDKRFWENPDHFHPDHFLPAKEKNRSPYCFLPFSGGTRACIGKVFANVNIKIFMATFLQRFEVEADGELPDIKLKMDISVRPINGYRVRIKERQWE